MPLNITVNLQGSPSEDDILAAQHIIFQENARRAAADPVEEPLPITPVPQLANSYESMLVKIIEKAHASYIEQALEKSLREDTATLWKNATAAQRQAAIAALNNPQ